MNMPGLDTDIMVHRNTKAVGCRISKSGPLS